MELATIYMYNVDAHYTHIQAKNVIDAVGDQNVPHIMTNNYESCSQMKKRKRAEK